MALYDTIGFQAQPQQLDNSPLLANRPVQLTEANCVIISVCNIIEAKYWQQTGIKIRYNYDDIYHQLVESNSGLQFDAIPALLELLKNKPLNIRKTFSWSKQDTRTLDVFNMYLKASLHKYQFATIGCSAIKNVCLDNHAMTVCGYNRKSFKVQTTYANQKRFINIDNELLFRNFIKVQCCDIDRNMSY